MEGPSASTGFVMLTDNAEAWAARWELLTDARSSIDLSTFIFDDDVFGFAVLGVLTDRALAGVKVRLLVDGRGSIALSTPFFGRDYLQELAASGDVDVHIFNPPLDELVGALLNLDATQISAGNHNKIIVVDKSIAIIGGRNVSANYFATIDENETAVVDADVLVDGTGVVAAITDVMDRGFLTWRQDKIAADVVNFSSQQDELLMFAAAMDAWVRGRIPRGESEDMLWSLQTVAKARLDHVPEPVTVVRLEARLKALLAYPSVYGVVPTSNLPRTQVTAKVVTTVSRARKQSRNDTNDTTDAFVAAIAGARRDIAIQSPSLILSPLLLEAFEAAGKRGVKITIVTNGPLSSDSRATQALFIDSWPELMARIPHLRIFTPGRPHMQHAKRAVFDDDLSFVGTYNLDPFSGQMNSETIVVTTSPAMAAETRAAIGTQRLDMDEYLVVRDGDGVVQRHPQSHPRAGAVMVVFGPRDQATADEIVQIEKVKGWLLNLQGLWDFDVMVW